MQDYEKLGVFYLGRPFDLAAKKPREGLLLYDSKSFAAPAEALRQDADFLRERVATTATSLLALLGIEADPLRSHEHILHNPTILDAAWKADRDLDLPGLAGPDRRHAPGSAEARGRVSSRVAAGPSH
jgi:hypothetical protein